MENKENYIVGIDPYQEVKTLKNKVFEALGEVSMCWSETPKGIFDSTNAERIGNELMKEIEDLGKTYLIDTKLIPKDMNVEEFIKNWKRQPIQIVKSEPTLQEAIEVLQKHLKEDKSEGSYYYSWQANIAMAFVDEVDRNFTEIKSKTSNGIIETANQAAKNFLDLLIKE